MFFFVCLGFFCVYIDNFKLSNLVVNIFFKYFVNYKEVKTQSFT